MKIEETVIELETKSAYQEKNIQELSQVVFEQQKQIERLEKTVASLKARLKEFTELISLGTSPSDEKPPHY